MGDVDEGLNVEVFELHVLLEEETEVEEVGGQLVVTTQDVLQLLYLDLVGGIHAFVLF